MSILGVWGYQNLALKEVFIPNLVIEIYIAMFFFMAELNDTIKLKENVGSNWKAF